jgi:hypothetical protein
LFEGLERIFEKARKESNHKTMMSIIEIYILWTLSRHFNDTWLQPATEIDLADKREHNEILDVGQLSYTYQ